MVFIPCNLFAAPLMVAIGLIDFYLLMAAIRGIAGSLNHPGARRLSTALQPMTDWPVRWVSGLIASRSGRPLPPWAPWLIVLLTAVFVRQIVLWFILHTTSNP
jgi:hypothetical protein